MFFTVTIILILSGVLLKFKLIPTFPDVLYTVTLILTFTGVSSLHLFPPFQVFIYVYLDCYLFTLCSFTVTLILTFTCVLFTFTLMSSFSGVLLMFILILTFTCVLFTFTLIPTFTGVLLDSHAVHPVLDSTYSSWSNFLDVLYCAWRYIRF